MKLNKIIECLEKWAPLSLQEEYDNTGLIIGNNQNEIKGVLVTLDCTEDVINEAIKKKCNLIISHHPLIFRPIKKITGSNYVERSILKAIENSIAIYSIHTNLDNIISGVNSKIAEKIELKNVKILNKKSNILSKIEFYVPKDYKENILKKLFKIGAGKIGNYDSCSFQVEGLGTFRPNNNASPFIGKNDKFQKSNEVKVELVFHNHLEKELIRCLKESHPYDEVAFYITKINNKSEMVGSGIIGNLKIDSNNLLKKLKNIFKTKIIKHTTLNKNKVSKIAICGGSGSILIDNAIKNGADVYITSDLKYHDFFEGDNKMLIVDIGHYESEQFTKELIFEYLNKKLVNIAIHLSKVNSNPIRYY